MITPLRTHPHPSLSPSRGKERAYLKTGKTSVRALSLLLPTKSHLHTISGVLAGWVARGNRQPDAAVGREAVLRVLFQFPGTGFPSAALAREFDAGDAGNDVWLRVAPAYFHADMITVRMLRCGNFALSADETAELVNSLKPLFGDAGFILEATAPLRWYLRCEAGLQMPELTSPEAVLGDDLARHLPTGDSGKRWRALHNEMQIILHNHPLNARLVRRGELPINGLWIWGGGALPMWVKSDYDAVFSEDSVLRALAKKANILQKTHLHDALIGDEFGNGVLDLVNVNATELESDWLPLIDHALRRKQYAEIRLLFESGERFVVRAIHRWRIWRRFA